MGDKGKGKCECSWVDKGKGKCECSWDDSLLYSERVVDVDVNDSYVPETQESGSPDLWVENETLSPQSPKALENPCMFVGGESFPYLKMGDNDLMNEVQKPQKTIEKEPRIPPKQSLNQMYHNLFKKPRTEEYEVSKMKPFSGYGRLSAEDKAAYKRNHPYVDYSDFIG